MCRRQRRRRAVPTAAKASLGAAVVTELAAAHPPAGLVLRSPFIDLASVRRVHYPFPPVRTLLRDRYPLAEQLARVTVPVTVVYGSADRIVPPDQSRAVAAAPGPTRLVEIRGRQPQRPSPARRRPADSCRHRPRRPMRASSPIPARHGHDAGSHWVGEGYGSGEGCAIGQSE
jgi:fermentation-respiration switch protein FrsA (DUF1100 family)